MGLDERVVNRPQDLDQATSNKKLVETSASLLVTRCIATRSKKLLGAPGIATSNKVLRS